MRFHAATARAGDRHIFLSKEGYKRDGAVVPANVIFKTDMVKLP